MLLPSIFHMALALDFGALCFCPSFLSFGFLWLSFVPAGESFAARLLSEQLLNSGDLLDVPLFILVRDFYRLSM